MARNSPDVRPEQIHPDVVDAAMAAYKAQRDEDWPQNIRERDNFRAALAAAFNHERAMQDGPHNDPPTPEHGLDYVDSENVPICYCGVQWSDMGCEVQQDPDYTPDVAKAFRSATEPMVNVDWESAAQAVEAHDE